jgi:DNA-binding LacI/PurR family transcriptional regulator
METVLRMGLHVPDEVAVIGMTNDEFDCITAPIALSGVNLNASAVGDQAARLLLRLIAGRPAPVTHRQLRRNGSSAPESMRPIAPSRATRHSPCSRRILAASRRAPA